MSNQAPPNPHTPLTLRIARVIYGPLSKVSRHPVLNVLVGFGLLFIGINEFLEQALPDYEGFFELHHAVILIGLTTLLHGTIELVDRLEAALSEHEARLAAAPEHSNETGKG
ncbi:hypothetical protein [Roseicyclus marinus]|uniref:hypothetical protein n=1 Tax=Roseicyclus marinus TaxID=2161673 RepID=UPI00240FB800|nr:hypothetical protein [Roseicyclus marinus]MDG3042759.1 hypothetical protein [Roseicyclus marinus]